MLRSTLALAATVALAAIIAGPLMEPHMQARLLHLRLHHFYSAHAPAQLDKIESMIEKYDGKEAALLAKIEERYGMGVPELDIWQPHDLSVGAFLAYTEAKKHALELCGRLEGQFPHGRAAVLSRLDAAKAQWAAVQGFASAPAKVLLLALAYIILASRLRGFARAVALVLVCVLAVVFVQPTVDDLTPASLRAALDELVGLASGEWARLALAGRVIVTTAIALVAALSVGRLHKSFVLYGWLLALCLLSNPHAPEGVPALDVVSQLGVADEASISLFRHTDDKLFAVHDLTLYSVLTLSPSTALGGGLPEWSSPMLAVGVADRWFVLSRVEASKTKETRVRIDLPGVALPVYAGPLTLGALLFLSALLSGL
jgi:hypothetical protein